MSVRLELVRAVLHSGYHVLLSDVDMIFLKDPLYHLSYDPAPGKQLNFFYSENSSGEINGGFILFKSNRKSIHFLDLVLHRIESYPEEDDQMALNYVWKSNPSDYVAARMPLERFRNGLNYWETPKYRREFVDTAPACTECVVIHNCWIVSLAAKRYRMRESGFWGYDKNGYYSNPDRKYITYQSPADIMDAKEAKTAQISSLKAALAVAHILNRSLVLPKFSCVHRIGNITELKHCSLLHFLRISRFEKAFPNYRESVFLLHPLVPVTTKRSLSPTFCFKKTNFYQQTSNCEQKIILTDPQGASPSEILSHFASSALKVLRFTRLDGSVNFRLFGQVYPRFYNLLETGFEDCHYRQYEDKVSSDIMFPFGPVKGPNEVKI